MQEISEARVNIAVNEIFTLLSTPDLGDKTFEGSSMHNLVDAIQMYLTETNRFREKDPKSMALISDMQDRFDKHDRYFDRVEMEKQFELTETFVCREQVTGTIRREKARRMEAAEELRLAAEIAQLKQFRETSQLRQSSEEIQRKISDAERAYFKRKMVVSKSSQMASSECRFQFVRIRGFFDEVHDVKKEGLLREHQRSRIRLEIIHRLNQSDARVKMLEVQISDRVYKKKLQDLNELHIAQNMEEAMLDLLDKVQTGKENAAKEVFELHVKNLKERQEADTRRSQELAKLQADATVEIAKLIASYLKDDNENDEAFQQKEEEVEAIERRKGQGNDGKQTVSVGELYDTVLWSVVKNHCGLTSSDSDCSSDRTFDEDDDDEVGDPVELSQEEPEETVGYWFAKPRNYSFSDGTSCSDASVDESSWIGGFKKGIDLSSAGNMHVKQFSKSYRKREKKLIEQQKVDKRRELTRERNAIRALKMHHQTIVEGLIESCLVERQNLREKIEQRMAALKQHQEETTKELRDTVIGEAATMQEALRADDKRVEDAETESFSKAQTMISAQVFHEVRNALSSVIAMSEIASSMKKDAEVSADQLMSSVEDMLQQIKEVVDYALKMLNNVLDISKITSGTFQLNTAPFDLQDVVARATRMQLAKARNIKMTFDPSPQPQIAFADADIVVRIITNLISNSIKFTADGGVQPFVCPLEDILSHEEDLEDTMSLHSCHLNDTGSIELGISNTKKRFVAVGVADTGSGLLQQKLKCAETAISQSDPRSTNAFGTRNSGFGLYLIQLLAKSLGSKLWLTSLEKCRNVLNADMLAAVDRHQKYTKMEGSSKVKSAITSGKGTVLYITLPVYEDGNSASIALHRNQELSKACDSDVELESSRTYTFLPRALACGIGSGTFRIMVADDVLMLRKGVLNALSSIFVECPVSFSTACSAEDMLRAVHENPFDMIICDNLFHHDASKLRRVECRKELHRHGRPRVFVNGRVESKKEIREKLSNFFINERFSLEDGDGELTGLDAIMKIAQEENPRFATPILMILSGNRIEIPPDYGIIVAQKPLKQGEFIKLLESNAPNLLRTGMCSEDANGSSSCSDTASMTSDTDTIPTSSETSVVSVFNNHGTQIFVSQS